MTTEKAVLDYLGKNGSPGGRPDLKASIAERMRKFRLTYFSMDMVIRTVRRIMYGLIVALILFCLFLVYAFFGNFGRWMGERSPRAYPPAQAPQ